MLSPVKTIVKVVLLFYYLCEQLLLLTVAHRYLDETEMGQNHKNGSENCSNRCSDRYRFQNHALTRLLITVAAAVNGIGHIWFMAFLVLY